MNEQQQAKILLNNEVKVTDHRSQFVGETGIVKQVMHDGRTLDIKLSNGKFVFLDVTLVSDSRAHTVRQDRAKPWPNRKPLGTGRYLIMQITKTSVHSGITRTLDLDVTFEEIAAWQAGELIQVAMPRLDADGREFIKTGITAEEWEEIFPPEEDE